MSNDPLQPGTNTSLTTETRVIREDLPPLPSRMQTLKLDHRGYPVPWFVAWIDGKPDFRVMDGKKMNQAVRFKKCWVCGSPLGRRFTFCIGPMCAINRTIGEPPSHHECVDFSARACPFLSSWPSTSCPTSRAMRRARNRNGSWRK